MLLHADAHGHIHPHSDPHSNADVHPDTDPYFYAHALPTATPTGGWGAYRHVGNVRIWADPYRLGDDDHGQWQRQARPSDAGRRGQILPRQNGTVSWPKPPLARTLAGRLASLFTRSDVAISIAGTLAYADGLGGQELGVGNFTWIPRVG